MSDHAKFTETFALKIPKKTQKLVRQLSDADKADLLERIRDAICRKLHETTYNKRDYLGE